MMKAVADSRLDADRNLARRWVDTWRRAAKELEEIRGRELKVIDTRAAIQQIFGSYEIVVRNQPTRTTSGLVEQQAWFAKFRP